jgi:mannose-1-phosphate guanylyltransferase
MKAMLLCAGLGSRLGELGAARPKPMFPVCDHPILEYGIANLVGHGITELVINTHHRGDVIREELGDGARFGAKLRYLHEDVILGTGGGLKHALPLLDPDGRDEPFLSLNGKLIFDVDLTALVEAYRQAGDVLGMMVVRRDPEAVAWGAVEVRFDRREPDARREGHDGSAGRAGVPSPRGIDPRGPWVANILGQGEHMFCGVHITRPSVVARLPEGEACMVRQGYLPWLHAGGRVAAWEAPPGTFAEHSTPERYLASNWALLDGAALRFAPGRLVGIDPTARIAPTAVIEEPVRIGPGAIVEAGARVGPYAVVGAGATVVAGSELRRAVLWAGSSTPIR